MTTRDQWVDRMLMSILIGVCVIGLEAAVVVCLIVKIL